MIYETDVFQEVICPAPPPELLSAGTKVIHVVVLVVDLEYPVETFVIVDLLVFLSVTLEVANLVLVDLLVAKVVVYVVVVDLLVANVVVVDLLVANVVVVFLLVIQ